VLAGYRLHRFDSAFHQAWNFLSRVVHLKQLWYDCWVDCIKINASADPKIVKRLINKRINELGKFIGADLDLDDMGAASMKKQMVRYRKLLQQRYNLTVEEAARIFKEGFDKQQEESRGRRQFAPFAK
jgi:hypothetical protein